MEIVMFWHVSDNIITHFINLYRPNPKQRKNELKF